MNSMRGFSDRNTNRQREYEQICVTNDANDKEQVNQVYTYKNRTTEKLIKWNSVTKLT